MAAAPLEKRVAALETEIRKLRQQLRQLAPDPRPWWEKIYGTFESDPAHEEAMKLGAKWRRAQRPRSPRRR